MNLNTYTPGLTALAVALAAMLLAIPLAYGGQRSARSSCAANSTYQQAVRAGDLPAIVAALHGGAPARDRALTSC
jgi:hypothetical protein